MSKVSVLKTSPSTVLEDYRRLMHLADYKKYLPKNKETVLKLNLSWSLYYPACSTEPWQLEGVLKTMLDDGYRKLHPMENRTVVTDVWKGAQGNKWLPILKKYGQKYEPLTEVEWVKFKPKGELLALDKIFPGDHKIPKMFMGKNVVHFPTIKCVHPDTEILQGNGEIVKIEEMVEKVHENCEVEFTEEGDAVASSNHILPSMVDDGRMMNNKALQFWKTPSPDNLFSIKTKTGREVIVSEVHPFLTPEGWKQAEELKEKDRIAVLRKIKIKGKSQPLPKIKELGHEEIDIDKIPFKKGKKYSTEQQKKIVTEYLKGKTTTEIATELNTHYETVRGILQRYKITIRWTRTWAKVPEKTSAEFWRWMGYFIAEGYANDCKGSMRFWWNNGNKKIVKEYKELTKELFGIELKVKRAKDRLDVYYFDCNHLIPFFQRLGLTFPLVADTKSVPLLLFKCPDEEIAAFLSAYLDGDGTVAKDGLHAVSKSKKLIEKIQLLFTRLSVVSFIKPVWSIATNGKQKEKQLYWGINVYSDDLVALSKHIRLHSKNKQENMELLVQKRKNSKKKPSNWDTLPVDSETFRRVREGLGFTQESSGKPGGVNSIENGYSLPTRPVMNYFIKLFENKDTCGEFSKEIEYFKVLASEDIAWDYIEDIECIKSDTDFLYDLTVPGTNNFVGNGIILHNTHGHTVMTGAMKNAFGGLITEKRHHCHKAIHEVLVDLLTIQKEIHPGMFAVMDGTVAGDGAGPRTMIPKIKNMILASHDQVAIDAISAKMMGYDPMRIKFIKLAHDKGLGIGDVDQIDIVGEDISEINFHFKTSKSPVIMGDKLFRSGPLRFVEPLLFHTPLFKMCVFASEFYHDKIWYNTVGRRHIDKFMKTEWGKLWQKY